MKQLSTVFLLIASLVLPALCPAADGVSLSIAEDGSTIAHNTAGTVLWQRYYTGSSEGPPAAVQTHAAPSSAATPSWDPLTQLASGQTYLTGPIFDSLGNAWVVISDTVNLIAIQSNGTSGTWQTPHIIGPVSLEAAVGVAVDQAGGFYVTYGASQSSTSYPLMWAKYTPAAGWQAPALIYTGSLRFNETFPVLDSSGRLVVVFNPNDGISSIASNRAQSSWGAVQTISPLARSHILPSVAGNKSGTRLALVYLGDHGLRYCFFNFTTGRWNPDIAIPDSEKATFAGYSRDNAFPLAVDETGDVTVVSTLRVPFSRYTIGGFRYEGGQWSMQQLLPISRSLPNPDNFGSIALNASGAVLVSVPTSDGDTGANISVFRYMPGAGWDTEIAAFYNAGGTSRSKVAWFESTGAVVAYTDYTTNPPVLKAALYSNGAWGSAPMIPGNLSGASPKLATALTGDVLLGIQSAGVEVTFLRP